MAELDDRLNRLLSDSDSMKKVIDVASTLLGKGQDSEASNTAAATGNPAQITPLSAPQSAGAPAEPAAAPDLTSVLKNYLDQPGALDNLPKQNADTASAPPLSNAELASATAGAAAGAAPGAGVGATKIAAIMAALPPLMQAMNGQADFVSPERLNLVKAMKPYMAGPRADSVDRAIKMANMAKAAKSALGLLGR